MRFNRQNRKRALGARPRLSNAMRLHVLLGSRFTQPAAVASHFLVLCLIFGGFHLDYGCQCPDCDGCQSNGLSQTASVDSSCGCNCCRAESGCCSNSANECSDGSATSDTSSEIEQATHKGCKCCNQPNLNYQIGELDPVVTFSPLAFVQLTPDFSSQVLEYPLDISIARTEFFTGRVPVHLLNCVWQI